MPNIYIWWKDSMECTHTETNRMLTCCTDCGIYDLIPHTCPSYIPYMTQCTIRVNGASKACFLACHRTVPLHNIAISVISIIIMQVLWCKMHSHDIIINLYARVCVFNYIALHFAIDIRSTNKHTFIIIFMWKSLMWYG